MLQKLAVLLVGIALLTLGSCRTSSPYNEEDKITTLFTPDPTDVNKVYKEWRESLEEESTIASDRRMFRKANYQFPVTTRFRQTIAFTSTGSNTAGKILISKQLRIGITTQYEGTWTWNPTTQLLTLQYVDSELKTPVTLRYEVITLVQDLLLIKVLP